MPAGGKLTWMDPGDDGPRSAARAGAGEGSRRADALITTGPGRGGPHWEDDKVEASLRILALVPDAATCLDSLRAAHAAARIGVNAQIVALHVQVDPARLMTSDEEVVFQQWRAIREGNSQARRDATYRIYREWLGTLGGASVRVDWRERIGAEEAMVDEESRDVDLVTIGKPRSLDGHDALHAALFAHRHLVLHAPPIADKDPVVGRSMAIAWKPTERSRNAIARTMRWLTRADAVHVIAVDRDGEEPMRLLHEAGIEAELHMITKREGSVGQTVLAKAHELKADSIVMGAYRYGEFIENLLGGVTHDILRHSDVPAFMVH